MSMDFFLEWDNDGQYMMLDFRLFCSYLCTDTGLCLHSISQTEGRKDIE